MGFREVNGVASHDGSVGVSSICNFENSEGLAATMRISRHPYITVDFSVCLPTFDSNVPTYFVPTDGRSLSNSRRRTRIATSRS